MAVIICFLDLYIIGLGPWARRRGSHAELPLQLLVWA